MDDITAAISTVQTEKILSVVQANVLKKALETQEQTIAEIIKPIAQVNAAEVNGVGKYLDITV